MNRTLGMTLLGGIVITIAAAIVLHAVGAWPHVGSPGPLTPGHADLACDQCHVGGRSATSGMNAVCMSCHKSDVGSPRNAHSPAYFAIVGMRPTPWFLSPTDCLDCHRSHMRKQRNARAMTFMPVGFCVACHADVQATVTGPHVIADHENFSFASCQTCHQFHGRTLFPPSMD